MGKVLQVEDYGARLRAAGQYADDCRELWKNALRARNALVVEAVDNGYAGHQVARDINKKQPHVIRILSLSEPDLSRE
jgi:hypothetical protein